MELKSTCPEGAVLPGGVAELVPPMALLGAVAASLPKVPVILSCEKGSESIGRSRSTVEVPVKMFTLP